MCASISAAASSTVWPRPRNPHWHRMTFAMTCLLRLRARPYDRRFAHFFDSPCTYLDRQGTDPDPAVRAPGGRARRPRSDGEGPGRPGARVVHLPDRAPGAAVPPRANDRSALAVAHARRRGRIAERAALAA